MRSPQPPYEYRREVRFTFFFHTPYEYRRFKNAPIATFVDKCTHQPASRILLTLLLCTVPASPVTLLYLFSDGSDFMSTLSKILFVVMGIWFYAGCFIIPKLADRHDWAGKIAEWELDRQRDPWGHDRP